MQDRIPRLLVPNARASPAATRLRFAGVSQMKGTLFAVGCMPLLDAAYGSTVRLPKT
jgi:hypothetical protein